MAKRGDHRDDDGMPMCSMCRRERKRAMGEKDSRYRPTCPFCNRILTILRRKTSNPIVDIAHIKTLLKNSPSIHCEIKVIDSIFDPDINFTWQPALIIGIDILEESILIAQNRKQFWVLIKGGRIKI